ncbi:predicted protein [Verticillium alfalfae VaMs.102]|uniref:Predicted protein n=1 Tax=Verticillium alfalfae (strain VaMs.102 / ATCC MYA-4576 / FGSC 10136) TaxID=526221 RepID=C9SUR3_VERA1|nr:predicted protein [Verticillium alfalfae VaMs.102]EEY22528.1 predicted protein [Verticillium alfalfae VaMs.102]
MEQAKPTPSRRRAARNNGKPALQRMYASENDLPVTSKMDMIRALNRPHLKVGSPAFDMQLSLSAGSAKLPRAAITSNAIISSHNRLVPASTPPPDFARTVRQTTPNSAAVPRLPSSAAFAGATFHASPAPSALPIPNAQQQPSPPATEPEMPTPRRPLANEARESPLEAMFRADRAEKEKARRPSFVSDASTSRHLFSPNAMPQGSQTMPRQHYGLPRDKPFRSVPHPVSPWQSLTVFQDGRLGLPFPLPIKIAYAQQAAQSQNPQTMESRRRSFTEIQQKP